MISSCKDVLGSDLLSVVIIQGVLRICYVDCIDLREGKVLFFHGSYSFFFISMVLILNGTGICECFSLLVIRCMLKFVLSIVQIYWQAFFFH